MTIVVHKRSLFYFEGCNPLETTCLCHDVTINRVKWACGGLHELGQGANLVTRLGGEGDSFCEKRLKSRLRGICT